jgi:hypothetical protein
MRVGLGQMPAFLIAVHGFVPGASFLLLFTLLNGAV